jgi:hypothetical protein
MAPSASNLLKTWLQAILLDFAQSAACHSDRSSDPSPTNRFGAESHDLQIRNLLEQENRIDRFVYIVPEPDLGSFILECFSGTRVALYVGLAAEFTRSFTEMKMIEASSGMTRWVAAAL